MGRCKDCKHVIEATDGLTCEHPMIYMGYHSEDHLDEHPDGLIIEGDEGWGWIVGPEFGCVHFVRK